MDKNYLVTKSNFFIMNSNYDLSLEEQKIILTLASMVQPGDEEFKPYFFRIGDFMKLLGIKNKSQYREVPKLTKELMKKVFEIKEDKKILQVAWLSSAEYEEGSGLVELQFSPKLKPYMIKLNKLYTSYRLANILTMKSKYSPRIYEILKCNEFKREKYIEIELNLLRKLLKADIIYPLYADFKRKIILQTQKELNKLTDISFEFEEVKTGRKVTSLRFYIESNEKDIIEIPKLIENVQEVEVKENENTITVDEIENIKPEEIPKDPKENLEDDEIIFLKNLFDNKLDNVDCAKILAVAHGNLDKIKDAYNIALQQPQINNLCAWIIACIKNDYSVPVAVTNTTNSKVDSFNDFEQRPYDFDELEDKLLNRGNKEQENQDEDLIEKKHQEEVIVKNAFDKLQLELQRNEKSFNLYTIDFENNEVSCCINGNAGNFIYLIENSSIKLINPSTNEIIASKKF